MPLNVTANGTHSYLYAASKCKALHKEIWKLTLKILVHQVWGTRNVQRHLSSSGSVRGKHLSWVV